jgi:hypothetical protein
VEDFGFAFAMVTVTLMFWERALRQSPTKRGVHRILND